MTIEQTVEVPPSRRIFLDLPPELPTGKARIEFTITPELKPWKGNIKSLALSDTPTPRADKLLGIAANLGDISIEEIRSERLSKYLK